MADLPLFSFNGLLCVAALWVATFVRQGKRDAVSLAACLLANFIVCGLEYTPYAVRHLVGASAPDVWLVADTLFGVAALGFGFWYWWGTALWALACVQVVTHLLYPSDLFDQYAYSDTLQTVLLAQLAVFFVIGGPRARDHLRNGLDRFRRSRRALAARVCEEADG